MDGRDAYEQIRVEPSHVERTAVTTPDGNMVSQVLQIGDCNALGHIPGANESHFLPVHWEVHGCLFRRHCGLFGHT